MRAVLALFLCRCVVGMVDLPKRRLSFVASTNAGSSSFQPLADLLLAHKASWNVAHAYCSSPGEITNETVLPEPPFCYNNWTAPIREQAPHILHVPIIQMLGNSGPLNFPHPYIFASKYVAWAQKWGFDGYLLDAEFKGDDGAFESFLTVFGDALHIAINAKNKRERGTKSGTREHLLLLMTGLDYAIKTACQASSPEALKS